MAQAHKIGSEERGTPDMTDQEWKNIARNKPMSKSIGNIFGVEVRTNEYVPDDKVYVMNKKTLDSFTVTNTKPITLFGIIKRYFRNLWLAIRNKL
jgi:hypothetical protein